jgi:hypothetical protein
MATTWGDGGERARNYRPPTGRQDGNFQAEPESARAIAPQMLEPHEPGHYLRRRPPQSFPVLPVAAISLLFCGVALVLFYLGLRPIHHPAGAVTAPAIEAPAEP